MSIRHFYSQTVADGTATSVVRPSDWNSAHNMVLNIAGNTLGTSQISGADIVWAGGNNVTLSANGSTVTIVGPNTVAQSVQTQASGNIAGSGFTTTTGAGDQVAGTHNSAGLVLAVPAYLTTAQPVGAYLTTAAQSDHSHNFATTTTNGSNIVVGTANSAGATIGVPAYLTTYAAQTTQTQPAGNIAGVGTTFAGTNVSATVGLDSNGLNLALSAAAGGGGGGADGVNVIGVNGGATQLSTTYQLSDANNVSFGLNAGTITASASFPAQTVQTQASGNIVGQGFSSTTTAGTAVVATQNSAGLSMAVPAYLTTAAQSNHSHNFATTTTGGSNIVVGTTNSAGATIGVPAFITTYANDLTSGRAGTGTTLAFAGGITGSMTLNTNGLNLSLSELGGTDTWFATGANTIAGTATSGTFTNDGYVVSGAGGISVGVSSNTLVISGPTGGGGTTNQTGPNIAVAGSTVTSGDVVFSNSNGVTFGMNGSTITASVAGGGGGGATIGNLELFFPANTAFTTHGLGTIYFQKFVPQQNVSFNNIERRASGSTVSNAASADCAYTITYGIYSQQSGASTSQYSLMGSSSMHIRAAFSSNTSCGITISGAGTSYVSASAGTGAMSLLSGYKHLYFPFTSTLNAGNNYAFAQVWSSATTGGTSALRLGMMECSNVNNLTVGKFFYSTFQATAASNIGDFGQGVYSSSSNGLPNTIALSGFTNAVSQNRMYLQFD